MLILICYPILAHAGFFSLGVIFGNNNPQTEKTETVKDLLNSQKITLLQAATNLDPDPAKGGADIQTAENKALIAESGMGGGFVQINEKKNGTISVYTVKEGDTLSQIAQMFGVSINTIRWANDFEGPIKPGQRLVIMPVNGLKHIVKNGGTIKDIAKIYEADAREIALFNGISEDTALEKGSEIFVPHAEKLEPKNTKTTPSSKTKAKPSTVVKSTGTSNWMTHPVPGSYKTQGIHGYNAIDLAAPTGTPIYAAAAGTVIISKTSGWNGGYAKYIVIEHSNGVQTLYAHNNANYVTVGQQVIKGQQIGEVGSTGNSTGPHVHFEVRGAKNPF